MPENNVSELQTPVINIPIALSNDMPTENSRFSAEEITRIHNDVDFLVQNMFQRDLSSLQNFTHTEQRLLSLGKGILPILETYCFRETPDIHTQYVFSIFASALAETEDIPLIVDSLRHESIYICKDMSAYGFLTDTLSRLFYDIRSRYGPDCQTLTTACERLLPLVEEIPEEQNQNILILTLAMSGNSKIREYASWLFLDEPTTQQVYRLIESVEYAGQQVPDRHDFSGHEVKLETTKHDPIVPKEPSTHRFLLTHDHIKHILSDQEHRAKRTPEQKAYIQLADMYWRAIRQQKRIPEIHQRYRREDAFIASVATIFNDAGQMTPIEQRIGSSELVALYGLIVNNGIDSLYEEYIRQLALSGAVIPTNSKVILEMKAKLAMGFIETLRVKNNEMDLAMRASDITVGIEVEEDYRLASLLWNTKNEDNLARKRLWKLINKARNTKKFTYAIDDETDEDNFRYDLSSLAEKYAEVVRILNRVQSAYVSYDAEVSDYIDVPMTTIESRYKPSASPRTQLRELLTMLLSGALPDGYGLHMTVAGIFLNTQHTEVMDISALSTAAGFLRHYPLRDVEFIQEVVGRNGILIMKEETQKYSFDGSNYFIFPFHKSRKEIDNLISKHITPYGKQPKGAPSVEYRSLMDFTEDGTFAGLVRDMTFKYLSGWGIRAVQQPDLQENSTYAQLKDAYETMIAEWSALLKRAHIENPKNEVGGRYKKNLSGYTKHCQYEKFILQVEVLSRTKPWFARKARSMIRKYQHTVRPIIGY